MFASTLSPMSYVSHVQAQWTVDEKVALLTNILQDSQMDPEVILLQQIEQRGVSPRWTEIPLPKGRSLTSCRTVFEDMRRRAYPAHPVYPVAPNTYPQPQLAPIVDRKRSYNDYETPSQVQRMLQPRPPRSTDSPIPSGPPTTNGESFSVGQQSPFESGPKPLPKKRGRPNKQEEEERRRAAEARGETYPDPKRRRAKKSEVTPSSSLPIESEPQTGPSPTAETPIRQTLEAREETSSGKRRRTAPGDQENDQLRDGPGALTGDDASRNETPPVPAQSPSDRLRMGSKPSGRGTAVAAPSRDTPQPQTHNVKAEEGASQIKQG